jgi:hypothetical protein
VLLVVFLTRRPRDHDDDRHEKPRGGFSKSYSAPGDYVFRMPEHASGRNVKITMLGGGGGGGGAVSGVDLFSGAGGGAGGTVLAELSHVRAGTKFDLTVGAGGASGSGVLVGTVADAGSNGTDTTVTVNSNVFTAGGAVGGAAGDASVTSVLGGTGGTVTTPTGDNITILFSSAGQDGHSAENTFDNAGGEGGSPSFGTLFSHLCCLERWDVVGGAGGAGGQPIEESTGTPTTAEISAVTGGNGQGPAGGGGGGAGSTNTDLQGNGGNGADGFILVEIL